MTKSRIKEKSFHLFLKKGWDNVSLAEIKKAANITSGGFYHYFDSKEELISELEMEYMMGYFEDMIIRLNQIEGTFEQKIENIIRVILGFDSVYISAPYNTEIYYKDFHALYIDSVRRNTSGDYVLSKLHYDLLEYIKETVKEAKINGEIIDEHVDEHRFATCLLATIKGISSLWLVLREELSLEEFIDMNTKTILNFVEKLE